MEPMDAIWEYFLTHLQPGTVIRNWTKNHDYLGGDFPVIKVTHEKLFVDPPSAKSIQVVPREDFEVVWAIWDDYINCSVRRKEIRDMTRYSKYIISLLHWYEHEVNHGQR
jgi:hypothetical protein